MVRVSFSSRFEKIIRKIKERKFKERVMKQIIKIKENPEVGKPMENVRKGTRELYISPYRLSYSYKDNKVIILNLYHKDEQ